MKDFRFACSPCQRWAVAMETVLTAQRMPFLFLEHVQSVKKYFEMPSYHIMTSLCHLGQFKDELKVHFLYSFLEFYILINIHNYANEIIYIT